MGKLFKAFSEPLLGLPAGEPDGSRCVSLFLHANGQYQAATCRVEAGYWALEELVGKSLSAQYLKISQEAGNLANRVLKIPYCKPPHRLIPDRRQLERDWFESDAVVQFYGLVEPIHQFHSDWIQFFPTATTSFGASGICWVTQSVFWLGGRLNQFAEPAVQR